MWNPFNSSNKAANIAWKNLVNEPQIDSLIKTSFEKPVAIFKHSFRCGISAMVLSHLEYQWDLEEVDLDIYFLDLITHRSVSNKISEDLGVPHQSPQIILIKEGKVVYAASHHAISVDGLKGAL